MKNILLIIMLLSININAQTSDQILDITKNYNFEKLNELQVKFSENYKIEKAKAIKFATDNNLPLTVTGKNGYFAELQRIVDEKPIYFETKNSVAAKSTRANLLHNGGVLGLNVEGQNMTAYVWDGQRALSTHNEFNVGGNSKITDGDTGIGVGTTNNNHGTHVTGTIVARGINTSAKGMAPQANAVCYTWNSDLVEATIAVGNGMLLSNHSYGAQEALISDWSFGAYDITSRRWDNLMFTAPYYLMVSAAGNAGTDSTSNADPLEGNSNRDKLSFNQTAKNGMVVANGQDLSVDLNGNVLGSASINSSSSQGPTDDSRVKPDITGNGTSVFSPIGFNNSSYDSTSGTSMSTPNVMGSLLLLQQLYNQENGQFALAATIKGLALHTADDAGLNGPDPVFGWGYMNTKEAAEIILSNQSILQEKLLNNAQTFTFDVVSDGTEDLEVSISWTDPPSNNVNFGTPNLRTPVLVNDLDIRVTKNAINYEPWKLVGASSNTTGDNFVDPYEKIEIVNPGAGTYTVTVNHKGTLVNSNQKYTIIVSGISSSNLNVDNNQLENLNVWPNPSNGTINLSLNNILNKSKINITNILGKTVYNKILNPNDIEHKLDLTYLNDGLYLITIEQNNKFYTKKLIINKSN